MAEYSPHWAGGFVVRRRLPTTAYRIYTAFTEPQKLAQWFVVPGYRTPADRIRVDPRSGGSVQAVMVPEGDGEEIPFSFVYGDLSPGHLVTLLFDQPREVVTVRLTENEGGCELAYEFVSWPAPTDEQPARRGVEDMLDRIEAGITQGTI